MAKPLVETKAKVGVLSIALQAYLPQFPQLVPEFEAQYEAFKKTLPDTIEIIDGGMVTTKEQSMAAGDKFRAADVDLVILQMLTYCTSYKLCQDRHPHLVGRTLCLWRYRRDGGRLESCRQALCCHYRCCRGW